MQLIADILTFDDNQEALSEQINRTSIDWDAVVIIGSNYLMLPALYCQLKEKELLPLIPEDLNIYLEEIAKINRGRNEVLLKEAREISELFQKENIEHVFIKGIALLAGGNYKDKAERMIGDIDILVAQNQLDTAFEILTRHGYTETVLSILERKNRRHLPRQISQQKFGATELHSEILTHKYKHLIINEQVLKNKRMVNGIAIPSIEDSIKIAILALQINDKAHFKGNLSFKTIYDCLVLNLPTDRILFKELCNEKHSQSFFQISSVFFKELTSDKSSNYSTFLKRYYVFRLQNLKLGRIVYSSVSEINKNLIRLKLLFYNKSYRTHLLKNKILNNKKSTN